MHVVHRLERIIRRGIKDKKRRYVLSPIDIIPDAIPFVGYLDDAAVVLLVLNLGRV